MQNRVRYFRRLRDESQEQLARATQLSRQAIIRIEKQRVTPNGDTMLAIARHFGKDVSEVFFEDGVTQEIQNEHNSA